MTLENLLAIRRLVKHEAGRAAILKLLAAAERNLTDAGVTTISAAALSPSRGCALKITYDLTLLAAFRGHREK